MQAYTNSSSGWQTAVVTLSPGAGTTQVGIIGQDRGFLRLKDPANTITDTDIDGDLIPDGWELSNMSSGYDPLVPQNAYSDNDHDGLDLTEELALGSDPNAADAQPSYPSSDAGDYVLLTLRVGEAGKMSNTKTGCVNCHETSVRVGSFMRTCPRNGSRIPISQDFVLRLLRGTNYPIQVTAQPSFSVEPRNKTNGLSPLYTATYTAQILNDTNGLYPFISDSNHLMGTNLPMLTEVLTNTATLYVPDLTIAADVDRDGIVDFTSHTDRTGTNQNYTFWINDDVDNGNDDSAGDLRPDLYSPDSSYPNISCIRDLEDFSRLQFQVNDLPGQLLTNSGLQLCVYLTNIVGSPSLRLFHATEASGGLGYLTNLTTATAQMNVPQLGVLTNGTPLTLSGTNWVATGSNQFLLPMIFEGISTGQCVITFGLCSNGGPALALSRPFYLNLQSITNMYEHWTVGDDTVTSWSSIPIAPTRVAGSAVYGAPTTAAEQDYILLVHGWRMEPWERRAFASTAYKRLWHLGYQGRFGLYSWPTDYTDVSFWDFRFQNNRQNYDRSERRAWKSAPGLRQLLVNLNLSQPPHRVRLISHSMGGIVASEALRLASFNTNRPPIVQCYIASQAASVAHAYDNVHPTTWNPVPVYGHFPRNNTNQPFFTGMTRAVQKLENGSALTINYHNQKDYALTGSLTWPLNQALKPDSGWDYNGVIYSRLLVSPFLTVPLNIDSDYYEIFAHIASASSPALGSSEYSGHIVRGEIGDSFDLNANFSYKDNDYEHSAEFNSVNMNRRSYWWQVLTTFSLTDDLPQP